MSEKDKRLKGEKVRGATHPEKYEIFIGNELAIQAIWKVVNSACPGEVDVASLLTNRAYSLGIPLDQLKGKPRDELVKRILLEEKGGAR